MRTQRKEGGEGEVTKTKERGEGCHEAGWPGEEDPDGADITQARLKQQELGECSWGINSLVDRKIVMGNSPRNCAKAGLKFS